MEGRDIKSRLEIMIIGDLILGLEAEILIISKKDLSTALMNLARTDFESGAISRPEFLAQVDR